MNNKIKITSKIYWKNLFADLFNAIKTDFLSFIFIVALSILFTYVTTESIQGIGGKIYPIISGILTPFCTMLIKINASTKNNQGRLDNSMISNILFGTGTDKYKNKSGGISMVIIIFLKAIVLFFKFLLAPVLTIIALFTYQGLLNKYALQNEQ